MRVRQILATARLWVGPTHHLANPAIGVSGIDIVVVQLAIDRV